MLATIKNISVTYDGMGKTFSSGDFISGRITLELGKDCKIDYLSIKAKGKSEVRWTEHHNKTTVTYHSKDKMFSIEQFIIREQKGQGKRSSTGSRVLYGTFIYEVRLCLLYCTMPSSFKGAWGKILYTLEAKLSRSMRISSKARADVFVPFQIPQHGTKDKKMKLFTSGKVGMDIHIERMGYYLGEDLKVVASIENSSSREIKPKYTLYQKDSFFARGKRRVSTKDILKELGEPIPPSGKLKVTKVLKIPQHIVPSIFTCSNIKCEYRLKIVLDVPYARDPEIKLPLVILPATQTPGLQPPPYSDFGFDSCGNANQPGWNSTPQFPGAYPPTAPGAYPPMAPGAYPPMAPGAYPPMAPGAYPPMAPGALAPPPAYGTYPSLSDFGGKS
uniref:Arrestin domain-containing protein 3 n=1 Tax=Oncorhynchus kisutch TaxID=8019 RepID=A0A8C7CET1_ONCKI